jgi:cystathionine beta-lyase family protein involved in aluminum resistance
MSECQGCKIVDIAHEIHSEIGSPTNLATPAIAFWVRSNIGGLNNLLQTAFLVGGSADDYEITPTFGDDEKYVLKKMYLIHYYDIKLRGSLGAAETDTVVEIETDGTRVRKVNKIQQSQTYSSAKRVELEELNKVVQSYRSKGASPLQVVGDDTIAGNYSGPSDSERNKGTIIY